jgi:hypothetical protein
LAKQISSRDSLIPPDAPIQATLFDWLFRLWRGAKAVEARANAAAYIYPWAFTQTHATNLLSSGAVNGTAFPVSGAANRALLSVACDDPDAIFDLERYDGSGYSILAHLAPGIEQTISGVQAGDTLRLAVSAASSAVCKHYHVMLRRQT